MLRAAALLPALAGLPAAAAIKVGTVQVTAKTAATPADVVSANIARFAELAADGAAQGARVLVYPEFGTFGGSGMSCKDDKDVSGFLPYCDAVPAVGATPCGGAGQAAALSCAAQQNKVWMSVNMCEAAADGRVWNTQVVFDDAGRLAASYRKTHPYSACFAAPLPGQQQNVSVTIDGVPFGVFTCKDILFDTPGVTLRDMGFDKFLYCAKIPIIGSATIKRWSKTHNATMVYSDASAGEGGVYVRGERVTPKPGGDGVTVYDV